MLLQHWTDPKKNIIFETDNLSKMDKFCYSDSCISPDVRKSNEMLLPTQEDRLIFTNFTHQCRRWALNYRSRVGVLLQPCYAKREDRCANAVGV